MFLVRTLKKSDWVTLSQILKQNPGFSSKMAAMLNIAGQAYLVTNIVLHVHVCEDTDAMSDKTDDLHHFRSYFKQNV